MVFPEKQPPLLACSRAPPKTRVDEGTTPAEEVTPAEEETTPAEEGTPADEAARVEAPLIAPPNPADEAIIEAVLETTSWKAPANPVDALPTEAGLETSWRAPELEKAPDLEKTADVPPLEVVLETRCALVDPNLLAACEEGDLT